MDTGKGCNEFFGFLSTDFELRKPIDPETSADDLPEKFHILTGSVIYLGFTQDDLKERATKLVAEIENGTKYVSMECFFNDFDSAGGRFFKWCHQNCQF